jgi:hypothetical protein
VGTAGGGRREPRGPGAGALELGSAKPEGSKIAGEGGSGRGLAGGGAAASVLAACHISCRWDSKRSRRRKSSAPAPTCAAARLICAGRRAWGRDGREVEVEEEEGGERGSGG